MYQLNLPFPEMEQFESVQWTAGANTPEIGAHLTDSTTKALQESLPITSLQLKLPIPVNLPTICTSAQYSVSAAEYLKLVIRLQELQASIQELRFQLTQLQDGNAEVELQPEHIQSLLRLWEAASRQFSII